MPDQTTSPDQDIEKILGRSLAPKADKPKEEKQQVAKPKIGPQQTPEDDIDKVIGRKVTPVPKKKSMLLSPEERTGSKMTAMPGTGGASYFGDEGIGKEIGVASKIDKPIEENIEKATKFTANKIDQAADFLMAPERKNRDWLAANGYPTLAKIGGYSEAVNPVNIDREIFKTSAGMVTDPKNWPFLLEGGPAVRPAIKTSGTALFTIMQQYGAIDALRNHDYANAAMQEAFALLGMKDLPAGIKETIGKEAGHQASGKSDTAKPEMTPPPEVKKAEGMTAPPEARKAETLSEPPMAEKSASKAEQSTPVVDEGLGFNTNTRERMSALKAKGMSQEEAYAADEAALNASGAALRKGLKHKDVVDVHINAGMGGIESPGAIYDANTGTFHVIKPDGQVDYHGVKLDDRELSNSRKLSKSETGNALNSVKSTAARGRFELDGSTPETPTVTPEGKPIPSGAQLMNPKKIEADPRRFQFRTEMSESGLGDVDIYNPDLGGVISVWKDPADGLTYCVDEVTEVLTKRGWKQWDAVLPEDLALTLNHETGKSEWQPILAVNVFPPGEREMFLMEGKSHSSLTTPDHKWPTVYLRDNGGRASSGTRRWRTSETLTCWDTIVLATECDTLPERATYTDNLVELVAWAWTEGSICGKLRNSLHVHQSHRANPQKCERIRGNLRELFGQARRSLHDARISGAEAAWAECNKDASDKSGMSIFKMNVAASALVLVHLDSVKEVKAEFLTGLTRRQLAIFVQCCVDADGWDGGDRTSTFVQKSGTGTRMFQMACALLGLRTCANWVDLSKRIDAPIVSTSGCFYTTISKSSSPKTIRPLRRSRRSGGFRIERIIHDGMVWCPTTVNGSWLARRNGTVYYTGNTVNGHHRLDLAKRAGADNVLVRYLDAPTAKEARAIGALQNIAEDKASGIDAAKFMRDSGKTPEDLEKMGFPLTGKAAKEGLALSKLSDPIFERVTMGEIPTGRAAVIGEELPDYADQTAVLQMIDSQGKKGVRLTDAEIREMARDAKADQKVSETQVDLFGESTIEKSSSVEKAKLSVWLQKQLSRDKKLFGYVAKTERARELAKAGNIIDVDQSKAVAESSKITEEVYQRLVRAKGPIADALREGAARWASGDDEKTVKSETYQKVQAAVEQELKGGTYTPSPTDPIPGMGESRLREVLRSHPGMAGLADDLVDQAAILSQNAIGMPLDEFLRKNWSDVKVEGTPGKGALRQDESLWAWVKQSGSNLSIEPYGEQLSMFGDPEKTFMLRNKKGQEAMVLESQLQKLGQDFPALGKKIGFMQQTGKAVEFAPQGEASAELPVEQGGLFGDIRRGVEDQEGSLFGPMEDEDPKLLFQDDNPIWYAKSQHILDDPKMPGSQTGHQWLSMLENKGVKADELKWMGIDDFLRDKKKVTKQELQDYIRENQVEVKEVARPFDEKIDPDYVLESELRLSGPTIDSRVSIRETLDADGNRILTAKPNAVGEFSQDLIHRELSTLVPLDVGDDSMLAMLKHKQIFRAVVENVDRKVVDILAAAETTPEDLLRNPTMLSSSFEPSEGAEIASGIRDSLRSISAKLRTKLRDSLTRGRDVELLPALRTTDLDPSEVMSVFSPELRNHENLPGRTVKLDAADSVTKPSAFSDIASSEPDGRTTLDAVDRSSGGAAGVRTESSSGSAGLDRERLEARVADYLDRHRRIVRESSNSYQSHSGIESRRLLRWAVEHGYDKFDLEGKKRVDITDAMRKSVMEGQPLFQGKKGATEFLNDGKAMVYLFKNADPSTFLHEFIHTMEPYLKPEDRAVIDKWLDEEKIDKPVARKEALARAFEEFHTNGEAPTEAVKPIFQRIQEMMRKIYEAIKDSPLIKPSKEVENLFNRWYGGEPEKLAPEREIEQILGRPVESVDVQPTSLFLGHEGTMPLLDIDDKSEAAQQFTAPPISITNEEIGFEPPPGMETPGPGAKNVNTVRETPADILQLRDSLAAVTSPHMGLMERLKKAANLSSAMSRGADNLTAKWNSLKTNSAAMWNAYRRPLPWTDFKDMLGKWDWADKKSENDAYQFARDIRRKVPDPARREAIINYIEAGGDSTTLLSQYVRSTSPRYKEGYRIATELTESERILAENVKNYFESRLQAAIDAGLLEHGVENYVNRIVKRPGKSEAVKKLMAEISVGKLQTNPRFAMKRIFETSFGVEQAGFEHVNKDIGFLITAYDLSFNRALSARAFVKSMLGGHATDGRPLVAISGSGKTIPSEEVGEQSYVIRPTTKGDETFDYKAVDHPALRKWKWIAKDGEGNPIYLQGDLLVHPEVRQHLKNVLSKSVFRQHPVSNAILKGFGDLKGTMLSLSPFHQVQVGTHGIAHWVNPAMVEEINFEESDTKNLMIGGLQLVNHHALEEFSDGVGGSGYIKYIPGIGKLSQEYQAYLFGDYIPRLKNKMAHEALKRNRERYSGDLSKQQIFELSANQANAAFGELNYRMLGRNPSVQDALRLVLLAPDFLEARGRFVGQALKPYGKEQAVALVRMAAILYGGARVMNMIFNNGDPKNDKPFSVVADGHEFQIRSIPGDLYHLYKDPRGFALWRVNPFTTRPAINLLMGKDSFGHKQTTFDAGVDYIKQIAPIPLEGFTKPEVHIWQSMIESFGIRESVYRSPAADLAHKMQIDSLPANLTKEQLQHSMKVKDLQKQFQAGTLLPWDLQKKIDAGELTEADEKKVMGKEGRYDELQRNLEHRSAKESMEIWKVTTPQEKSELRDQMLTKIKRSRTITAKQREEYTNELMENAFTPPPTEGFHWPLSD